MSEDRKLNQITGGLFCLIFLIAITVVVGQHIGYFLAIAITSFLNWIYFASRKEKR